MGSLKTVFLFYSTCVDPARESELSAWYDDVHIPDVEALPGFTSCARYHLTDPVLSQGSVVDSVERKATYLTIMEADVGLVEGFSRLRAATEDWKSRGRYTDAFHIESAQIVTIANPSQSAQSRENV